MKKQISELISDAIDEKKRYALNRLIEVTRMYVALTEINDPQDVKEFSYPVLLKTLKEIHKELDL